MCLKQCLLLFSYRDSDEDDHKKKIKGLKGFGNFLRDLASEDDFMGRAFYHLKVKKNMAT